MKIKMTATQVHSADGSSSVEGLPKSFVCSMRTLFDIMDDEHIGYVRFSEIERRWQEDGTQGLPEGVLSSLRKVTPPNGFLSFDRFCTGLKMCLLKNRGKEEPVPSFNIPSTLSPTSSLEMIPPLKASSPQTSPQHRTRPLSAPLLDQQDLFLKQPLTNGNLINGLSGSRKAPSSSYAPQNIEKGKSYPGDYPPTTQSKTMTSTHNLPQQQHPHSSIDAKIYANKSDIRMGIGGIKCIGKCPPPPSNGSSSAGGPPKPPRTQEGFVNHFAPHHQQQSQRRIPHSDSRMTNSLERESRVDRRWNRERDTGSSGTGTRCERGGSLERLLDSSSPGTTKEVTYGPPLNRTGMRSALQTWFKERSKSDLQQDSNNNYHHSNVAPKRYNENYYKEARGPPPYPAGMEMAFRGSGDGVDSHRSASSGSSKSSYLGRGAHPPPPPIPAHTRSIPPPPPPVTNGAGLNDAKIYGKPVAMETVVAVPANYNPGGGRGESGAILSSTNAAAAHGLYVAPQPPQLAVHKKTAKKKEPRRHTLQNGVDQNVMKRLRQLEAERDTLYQGLDVVERAKVWYKTQLQAIAERIHYLPLGPARSEPSLESQQEKLHFQLARIHEINAHLRALMDASDKGLPAHMNLAIRGSFAAAQEAGVESSRTLDRLKEQNKLLTEEVSTKSERITTLEREKAALLRELFQARASHRSSHADSTFM